MERVLQLKDLHHHGVGVREEQPHLWEEPPHVEVVGLLHHELGEQRAGADLGGHTHAGLAAVRLERLHEGQEPLRVVDLELEVRHGALAHGPLELGRVHVGVRVPEGVHAAAAEDGVLGELHHLLGDHAPHRLELPPLAVLELHEARHEGAAGEAVGPVQPPGPGAQHVPQELEPLAVHALLHVHAEEGHELLAERRGEAEALRHVRGVRPVQALPDLHARGGSLVQVVVQLRGEVVVHEEQVAHLLGVGLPVQAREARLVQPAQPRRVVFGQGDRQGPLGMGSVIAAGYMALKSKYEIQLTGFSGL